MSRLVHWTPPTLLPVALLALLPMHAGRSELQEQPYSDWPVLTADRLDGELPGKVPRVFCSGFLKPSDGFHSAVVFSPDGDEACWTAMSGGITYMSRRSKGVWNRPTALRFDSDYGTLEPFYSADGERLYFLSFRPPAEGQAARERIWYVERREDGWSQPALIDDVVARHPTHWQFSLSSAGNLYFSSEIDGVRGGGDIYCARFHEGRFEDPADLGPRVNSDQRDFCPFIAPDESYLLFARDVPENHGRSDLFVSFRAEDGSWSEAVPLSPEVNSKHNETSPVVTPDGKHLIFLRVSAEMNDLYWVSASVIEEARRR